MAKEGSVAPKERINVTFKPSTGGAQEEIELPLKLLAIGDYTHRKDDRKIEDRKPISIDKMTFDEVLGFLEAQAGRRTDDLDDLDLLVASGEQHDREFGLLFNSSGSSRGTSNGHSSSGNAKLLFKSLDQLVQFDNGQRANGFDDVFFGNCHLKILQI